MVRLARHIMTGSMLGTLAMLVSGCSDGARAFDSEAFQRNEMAWWCGVPVMGALCAEPRTGMWDAVEQALSAGMSRDEVIALLGPADMTIEGSLLYAMGGIGIDEDYLAIHFDGDGGLERTAFTRF